MKKLLIAIAVILSSSQAFAAGEVLKLDTKGVEYCRGAKPLAFNQSNDLEFWIRIDSSTAASIYADADTTMLVSRLSLSTQALTDRTSSFVAFSGNSINFFSAVGTLGYDESGDIKTIKANVIRKGVFNSCYSRAKVTGKRVN